MLDLVKAAQLIALGFVLDVSILMGLFDGSNFAFPFPDWNVSVGDTMLLELAHGRVELFELWLVSAAEFLPPAFEVNGVHFFNQRFNLHADFGVTDQLLELLGSVFSGFHGSGQRMELRRNGVQPCIEVGNGFKLMLVQVSNGLSKAFEIADLGFLL